MSSILFCGVEVCGGIDALVELITGRLWVFAARKEATEGTSVKATLDLLDEKVTKTGVDGTMLRGSINSELLF